MSLVQRRIDRENAIILLDPREVITYRGRQAAGQPVDDMLNETRFVEAS